MENRTTTPLNQADRHKLIMDILAIEGSCPVRSLAERLRVSQVTIRKDLSILEGRNLLYRSHGTAVMISPHVGDLHLNEKEKLYAREKKAIARYAASLVSPCDTLFITSGTTMFAFAQEIVPEDRLGVVTSSAHIALHLSHNNDIDVMQLGGIMRYHAASVVGPDAEEMIAKYSCNKLFMSVDGIDLQGQLMTYSHMESSLKRRMIECASQVILLVDSSKFGKKGFSLVAGLEHTDIVITDRGIPKEYIQMINEKGIRLTIVDV